MTTRDEAIKVIADDFKDRIMVVVNGLNPSSTRDEQESYLKRNLDSVTTEVMDRLSSEVIASAGIEEIFDKHVHPIVNGDNPN